MIRAMAKKSVLGVLAVALGVAFAASSGAQPGPVSPDSAGGQIAALDGGRIQAVLDQAQFAGTVLIARGDTILYERAFGTVAPGGTTPHRTDNVWRWASITKQVTATIAMQEVSAGRLDLDTPIRTYLPESRAPFADRITARMLMQHISGLPHPDDGPIEVDGWPRFYRVPLDSADTGATWCEGPTDRAPPSAFRYGDCDFIMMGAVLEAVSGKSFADLVEERIAEPLGLDSVGMFPGPVATVPGFDGERPESSAFRMENFGAGGAIYGSMRDLFAFDRALMTGRLIPDTLRTTMWTGEPRYGFAALGQWAYSVSLARCGDASIRIIERRGFIGGVSLRNIILPERDMVIIMASNRTGAEAAFGEVWQQAGLTHDVMSAVLCPAAVTP